MSLLLGMLCAFLAGPAIAFVLAVLTILGCMAYVHVVLLLERVRRR